MRCCCTMMRKMNWQSRFREWKALFDWATEHRVELEAKGRMTAIVYCLQRHWGDMQRLKEMIIG